ncbi:fungal-specific transcription factor domain-containing protein [Hypoxylon sp. FL1284]|nr:fungal-specific transcription factor domain-containing protein [Hypoxylon sp. FL1284]
MASRNSRKACDLCYRKKIKCDAQQPRCSNCQVYSTECTREATSRRKKKREKHPTSAQIHGQQQQQAEEQQVAQADDGPDTYDQLVQQIQEANSVQPDIDASSLLLLPPPPVSNEQDSILSSLYSSLLSPAPSASHGRRRMELPPEHIVRHFIDVYFATVNGIMPLFHPECLYRAVDKWYRQPADGKQPSGWAAINVALALAQCHSPGHLSPAASQAVNAAECLENAQSVVADILAGDMDLQGVQILLGLAIFFMCASPYEAGASITFVSTAMRLAQAMGMHRRDFYEGFAPVEALQRRRVFWIAYILDRDVAARTRQAPIQSDADMDIDLPSEEDEITVPASADNADADAGFVRVDVGAGKNPMIRFNLFRARVELAQIQSRVYDCIFSVRARHMDAGESARLSQGIRLSIQQWKARLPAALSVDVLSSQADNDNSSGVPTLLSIMYCLHSLITVSLGQLCRVDSMDSHWIEMILSCARGLSDGKTMSSLLFPLPVPPPPPPPPLPQGWNVLVSECRDFMQLFQSVRSKHPTFINVQLCPFTSGLLCLSVNSFLNFDDGNRLADQRLMAGAAAFLGDVKKQIKVQAKSESVSKVLDVYTELEWRLRLLTTELVM